MVEKITVSRDEILHFPWLDHTWVYVYYTQDEVTATPLFPQLLIALLRYGIRKTTGKDCKDITVEGSYLFIKHDTNEIVDILVDACDWLLKYAYIKDPTSPKGTFFEAHKDLYFAFLAETKKTLEEKKYTYYFQRVDGMN